jgi:hypothetical protein
MIWLSVTSTIPYLFITLSFQSDSCRGEWEGIGSPLTTPPLVISNNIVSSTFPVKIQGLGGHGGTQSYQHHHESHAKEHSMCYAAQSGPHAVPAAAAAASIGLAEEWPDSNKINSFEKSVLWKSDKVHNVSLKASLIAHILVHLLIIPTLFIIRTERQTNKTST